MNKNGIRDNNGEPLFKKGEKSSPKARKKDTLVEFFRKSPLYDFGIDLERSKEEGQKEPLNTLLTHSSYSPISNDQNRIETING